MEKNNHFGSQHFYLTVITVLVLIGAAGIVFTVEKGYNLSRAMWKTDPNQIMYVTGTSHIKAMPDIALVSYTIRADSSDVSQASVEVSHKLDATIAALVAAGIARDDIYLSQYQVSRSISMGEMPAGDSSVSQNITVEIAGDKETLNRKLQDLEKVALANDLVPSMNSNSHICLDFSNPAAVFGAGRRDAVNNAKAKAYDLADAAGVNLGRVVNVSDNMYGFGRENSPYSNYCATNLGSGRVIEEQDVPVSVSVNFEVR